MSGTRGQASLYNNPALLAFGRPDSPFPTPRLHTVFDDGGQTFNQDCMLFEKALGDLTIVRMQAAQHNSHWDATTPSDKLVASDTPDRGLRITNTKVIYDNVGNAGVAYRNLCNTTMENGTWGFMAAARTETAPWQSPRWWYSTDEGATWLYVDTVAAVSGVNLVLPYQVCDWPDGSNVTTNRRICYGYNGTGKIVYSTTSDGGLTWSDWALAGDSAATAATNEFVRMRVGVENKWVFFVRSEDGNSYLGFSTDQVTITGWTVSPVTIKSNGPGVIQETASRVAWLFSASRRAQVMVGTAINHMNMARVDVGELYASAGVSGIGPWTSVGQLPQWETGYAFLPTKMSNGQWYVTINSGEPYQGGLPTGRGGAISMMLSNAGTGVSHPYGGAESLAHRNLLTNGDGRIWTVAGPIVPGLTRVSAGDNSGVMRANGVAGSTFSQVDGGVRMQRDSGNAGTQALNRVMMFDPRDVVALRGKTLTVAWEARAGADFSAASGRLDCYVFSNATDGPITSTDGSKTSNVSLNQTAAPTQSLLNTSVQPNSVTIQVPMDAAMLYVRFNWTPVGTAGTNDWCEVLRVRAHVGYAAGVYAPEDYALELRRCAQMATYAYWTNVGGPGREEQTGIFATRLWAGRPLPASDHTGRVILITDIGVAGGSFFISNGTNWKPMFPVMLARSAVPSTQLTGTTSHTIFDTYTLPAGLLGTNGSLLIYITASNNNSGGTKTLRGILGGIGGTAHIAVINTTNIATSPMRTIMNQNNAALQLSQAGNYSGVGGTTLGTVPGTIDTSAACDFVITGQLSSGADNMTREMYEIWLRP